MVPHGSRAPDRRTVSLDQEVRRVQRLVSVSVAQSWPDDRPGGLNRYAADLHAALLARGVDDRLVVFGPASTAGPGVHRAGSEDASLSRRLTSIRSAAAGAGTDAAVLATHFALYGTLPALTPPLRRLPLVAHFHGPWADESRAQGARGLALRAKDAVEGRHVRSARSVITASAAFADLVVERHAVPRERVRVVHPGVDTERFTALDEEARTALRASLGVGPDDFLAVTARRLVPRMGLEVLLGAWPAAPGRRLVVIGDGPSRAALESAAAGVPGAALVGRVEDEALVRWYQAADVVVVPSTSLEGFGLVVLESLACGTPVLASAVGGMTEVLPLLDPGLLVAPGDVEAWRARLEAGARGDGLPGRDACREFALTRSVDRFAAEVSEVYGAANG